MCLIVTRQLDDMTGHLVKVNGLNLTTTGKMNAWKNNQVFFVPDNPPICLASPISHLK